MVRWKTYLLPQTSSQSGLLIVTDPNQPGKIAFGVAFLQSLNKFSADYCWRAKSVIRPSYRSVRGLPSCLSGLPRKACIVCVPVQSEWETDKWRLNCKSRWMKNNEIHSAASAKRRWSKKDDFSVWLFRMSATYHSLKCNGFFWVISSYEGKSWPSSGPCYLIHLSEDFLRPVPPFKCEIMILLITYASTLPPLPTASGIGGGEKCS